MTNRYREREPIWWKRWLLGFMSYLVDQADYAASIRTPEYPKAARDTPKR